jgi:2-(1,2-epoxy-1,2-dihydrophenyl)acetyl-CoA isomerase
MSNFKTIQFEIQSNIAHVTLNRPDAGNSMNYDLASELADAALICDTDESIKVVLLTGNGKMFSAGGDLKAFAGFGDETGQKLKGLADKLHKAISLFARMKPVVVIAVNGMAAGAGLSLAASGDYVLASETAKFTMAYTGAGLSPDGSSTYYLPRLIGLRRTQDLMLTNRVITAQEALDWGLVTRITPNDDLNNEAIAVAKQFAAGPRGAHATIKKLLLESLDNGLESQMELEGQAIANASMSPDGIEGIKAFIEKRKPHFG